MYDFAHVESKTPGQPWISSEDHLQNHCYGNDNESVNVYAIIQIGLQVAFYKYTNSDFSQLSPRLHLRQDVHAVTAWADYLKSHPLVVLRE
jgi:arginine/ornithine N-succinyltransferase beta subunit